MLLKINFETTVITLGLFFQTRRSHFRHRLMPRFDGFPVRGEKYHLPVYLGSEYQGGCVGCPRHAGCNQHGAGIKIDHAGKTRRTFNQNSAGISPISTF